MSTSRAKHNIQVVAATGKHRSLASIVS